VLTVTTVAVRLAMGRYFPRTVRALPRDRPGQLAHGLSAATFACALLAIRQLDDQASGGGSIRADSLLVASLLMLASVVALVLSAHPATPPYDQIERKLAAQPAITVPAVTLDGLADGNFPATDGTAALRIRSDQSE
jgi:uncharacterized membrane protein